MKHIELIDFTIFSLIVFHLSVDTFCKSKGTSGTHRIIESLKLEKTSKITETTQQCQVHYYIISLSTTFTHFLNTLRSSDSTTSQGNLFQWLTTPSVKNFF